MTETMVTETTAIPQRIVRDALEVIIGKHVLRVRRSDTAVDQQRESREFLIMLGNYYRNNGPSNGRDIIAEDLRRRVIVYVEEHYRTTTRAITAGSRERLSLPATLTSLGVLIGVCYCLGKSLVEKMVNNDPSTGEVYLGVGLVGAVGLAAFHGYRTIQDGRRLRQATEGIRCTLTTNDVMTVLDAYSDAVKQNLAKGIT